MRSARWSTGSNAALATPDDSDALQAAVVSSWPFAVGEAGLPTAQSGWGAAAARVLADLTARLAEPVAASDDAAALGRELARPAGAGLRGGAQVHGRHHAPT